jgi:hypothetical protein
MLGSSEVAINLRSSVGQEQILHHGNECLKRQLARRAVASRYLKLGAAGWSHRRILVTAEFRRIELAI